MSSGFPREKRITRAPELKRVLKEGKRLRTKYFDVRISASPLLRPGGCRVGIIVPKGKRNSVERNQLKRRLRELIRHFLLQVTGNDDLIILANERTYQATFDMLSADVLQLRDHFGERLPK